MSRSCWIVLLAVIPMAPLVLAVSGCKYEQGVFSDKPENSYQCTCDCTSGEREAPFYLAASGDDAEEDEDAPTKNVFVNGLNLDLGDAPSGDVNVGPQVIGIRFPKVDIPNGATILSAFVQFWASGASSVASSFQIRGEASDNAEVFTTAPRSVSSRAPTNATVNWPSVPAWSIGEAGPAQRTPDLKAVVQEIVNRPGWTASNAMALIIKETVAGSRRAARSWDGEAAGSGRSPVLTVRYKPINPISFPLYVCMNPLPLTDAELKADCEGRVDDNVQAMGSACNYPICNCTVRTLEDGTLVTNRRFDEKCGNECTPEPLKEDCSNFDPNNPASVTATNRDGLAAVCTAHSPLAAALFGKRSQCNVSGQATITVDGESPDAPSTASGIVELIGRPCPGGSCAIGLSHRLDLSDVTFSNFWASATFTNLVAVGGSLTNASLDTSGAGVFAPNSTLNSGRGSRGDETKSIVAANSDVIHVNVDWTPGAATCSLSGAMVGAVDPETKRCENAGPKANIICATDHDCATNSQSDALCSDGVCNCLSVDSAGMTLALNDLHGPIVNQPPTANAGADQPAVECNIAGGARFMLDGSASSDPDANISDETWFRGSRTGPAVGFALKSVVEQALNTQVLYVLRVIDAFGQSDEDTTTAKVVDTTPPVISCNAPATIKPPTAPVSFTATATDVCDPQVTPMLSSPSCYTFNKTGKKVYRTDCIVTLQGDTITISDSGGVDDYITWTAQAGDDSGNTSSVECQVHVVKPPPRY